MIRKIQKHHAMSLLFIISAFSLFGCAAQGLRPELEGLNPVPAADIGFRALDAGKFDQAAEAFSRVLTFEPTNSLAMVGQALVAAARKRYTQAEALLDRAESMAEDPEAQYQIYVAWLRYYAIRVRDNDITDSDLALIVERAEGFFNEAYELDPESPPTYFYMGMVYKGGLEFDKVGEMFYRVLRLNGSLAQEARREWELIEKIQQAAPRTRIGRKIALVSALTRAEAAALVVDELDLPRLLQRVGGIIPPDFNTPQEQELQHKQRRSSPENTRDHYLQSRIDGVLRLGLRGMEVSPDGEFNPIEPITKGIFALLLEDVLIRLSGDKNLAVRFIGRPSPFSDARNDHYAFNAIMVATKLGLLSAGQADRFGLLDPVSGIDGLLAVRRLQDVLRLYSM